MTTTPAITPDMTIAELMEKFPETEEIMKMLTTDRAKLINLAYRLDIDERRFEACFRDAQDNEEIAKLLAHLFFEREKKKVLHRQNHVA